MMCSNSSRITRTIGATQAKATSFGKRSALKAQNCSLSMLVPGILLISAQMNIVGAGRLKAQRTLSGVRSVVSKAVVTITATSGSPKIRELAPIAVTIRLTSLLEIMPHRHGDSELDPLPYRAANPQPINLLTTATEKMD